METIEFTKEEAQNYLKNKNKNSGRFYINIFGWDVTYSIKPTWCTPTGKDRNFPRTTIIKVS